MKLNKLLIATSIILYFMFLILVAAYSYTLFIVFLGISFLIFLITKIRFEPFLSVLITAIILGLFLGLSPTSLIDSIEKGTGSLLGHLSLILGLGAIFGKILEELGAIDIASKKLITTFGVNNIQLGLLIAGMCISFSLFFDVAFILIIPIVLAVVKTLKTNKLYLALPTSIAVLTIHALFPPHPSPSIIVKTFNLNMGEVFLYGLIVAIPTVLIGGIFFTNTILKEKINTSNNNNIFNIEKTNIPATTAIILILLPVLLITLPIIILALPNIPEIVKSSLTIISNPVVSLLISILIAIILLLRTQNKHISSIVPMLSSSIKTIAVVLLINGAAGGLKQVLVDAQVTDEIVRLTTGFNISPLIISFVVAAVLRVALGSATISAITTLAIVEPLVANIPYSATFIMLSITAGSMFCSHVNDPGFWLYKQYLNLDFKTTFKTWTLGTSIASIVAFGVIYTLAQLS